MTTNNTNPIKGTCTVCGRSTSIKSDGTTCPHGTLVEGTCSGSGSKPFPPFIQIRTVGECNDLGIDLPPAFTKPETFVLFFEDALTAWSPDVADVINVAKVGW